MFISVQLNKKCVFRNKMKKKRRMSFKTSFKNTLTIWNMSYYAGRI